MDLTQGTKEEKNNRAKKMMLWFGLISLIMSFMGWTSAYIVSRTRPDWLSDLELPNAFVVSLVVILISSLTFILAKRALKSNNRQLTTIWLVATLFLPLNSSEILKTCLPIKLWGLQESAPQRLPML